MTILGVAGQHHGGPNVTAADIPLVRDGEQISEPGAQCLSCGWFVVLPPGAHEMGLRAAKLSHTARRCAEYAREGSTS